MEISEILSRLVLERHVPISDALSGDGDMWFVLFFDVEGNEVPADRVEKASPGGTRGELEYFEPTPGIAYYAHLRLAHQGANALGSSTRYEIAAPDWRTNAHVTEPAAGGPPDVIVEDFAVTPGSQVFAQGIASKF